MTSRAAIAVVLAMGCGAQIGGGGGGDDANQQQDDASVAKDAAIDAPVDARPCMGGTAAAVAPDGSCLVFVNIRVTNVNAKAACMAMNAHLAYLKVATLDTFAEQHIGMTDTWIGATDRTTEGTFLWDDGTALGYTNWGDGEPNNGGSTYQEDCVIIAGSRVDKGWDDRPCDASEVPTSGNFAYLCQY